MQQEDALQDRIREALRTHDRRVAELGLDIWIGSEPTFTRRHSDTAEWTAAALGADKLNTARTLLRELAHALPGSVVMRCVGRQYPHEETPRWSFGLLRSRDGSDLYAGPPDPLLITGDPSMPDGAQAETFAMTLARELERKGYAVHHLPMSTPDEWRWIFARPIHLQDLDPADERLERPPLSSRPIPPEGATDSLAADGLYLLRLRRDAATGSAGALELELPALGDPILLRQLFACAATAAERSAIPALVFRGFPPPVAPDLEWTTLTPDPAVLELNAAPFPDVEQFYARSRLAYDAAERCGLTPYRLYFNGQVADSGGGGQLTFGGPTPQDSPFLRHPELLPSLIRYTNAHPSLSYLFAHDYVGPCGQSVRTDERGPDALAELNLALRLLEPDADPETLWRSLAPHLTDASGNSHRAEINIEKLWNPHLPGRGHLGLVELRGLRMQHSAERAAAIAALFRAVLARLSRNPPDGPLVDWGHELHSRFGLPYYLERDLSGVLDDLRAHDLDLGEYLRALLLADEFRCRGEIPLPGCRLEIRQGLEFWPLVGDTGSQEGQTSRLVDSSTQRIELRLIDTDPGSTPIEDWWLAFGNVRIPWTCEPEPDGRMIRVLGLRYRSFVPWRGLHPQLPRQSPIKLRLGHPELDRDYRLVLHDWRPDGSAYAGLPVDHADARERRAERIVCEPCAPAADPEPPASLSGEIMNGPCLDLRWL